MPTPLDALVHTTSPRSRSQPGGQVALALLALRRAHLVVLGGHDRVGQGVAPAATRASARRAWWGRSRRRPAPSPSSGRRARPGSPRSSPATTTAWTSTPRRTRSPGQSTTVGTGVPPSGAPSVKQLSSCVRPGRLGRVRQLRAVGERVEQRRLADVRPADDRHLGGGVGQAVDVVGRQQEAEVEGRAHRWAHSRRRWLAGGAADRAQSRRRRRPGDGTSSRRRSAAAATRRAARRGRGHRAPPGSSDHDVPEVRLVVHGRGGVDRHRQRPPLDLRVRASSRSTPSTATTRARARRHHEHDRGAAARARGAGGQRSGGGAEGGRPRRARGRPATRRGWASRSPGAPGRRCSRRPGGG